MSGSPDITFDISRVPFSRFGSYFAVSYLDRPELPLGAAVYLRSVHGHGAIRPELFRLDWADGQPIEFDEVEASPASLTFHHSDGGKVVLCIPEPGTVRIYGERAGLRLEMPPGPGSSCIPETAGAGSSTPFPHCAAMLWSGSTAFSRRMRRPLSTRATHSTTSAWC